MIVIESRQNGTLKHFVRLAKERKYRQACGEMLCEGEKMLREALAEGVKLKNVLVHEAAQETVHDMAQCAAQAGAQLFCAPDALFRQASNVETPQTVIFSCEPPRFEGVPTKTACALILDGLQDPGNLGTILRTADAFGVGAVVLAEGCADPYAPKVVRATMGAIFRLPLWQLPLAEAVAALRAQGLAVYAAALTEQAVPLSAVPLAASAVIVGSEGRGVSQAALTLCDAAILLPMRGRAESLNAGVAASILLWEMTKSEGASAP